MPPPGLRSIAPRAVGALLLSVLLLTPFTPARGATSSPLTLIVVSVESLSPSEVVTAGDALPTLQRLRARGTWYTESRSVFPAQGLPGHASLLTGTYPETHGVPANRFWTRGRNKPPRAPARPTDLQAPTLLRLISRACPTLGTAALIGDAGTAELYSSCGREGAHCGPFAADPSHWFDATGDPAFNRRLQQAPDSAVMAAARATLPDASVFFISLADLAAIGRLTAPDAETGAHPERQVALQYADQLLGELVADLEQSGRWDFTVMVVTSQHGLEWPGPLPAYPIAERLETLWPATFLPVGRGGFQSFYLRRAHDPAAWKAAREALIALRHTEGVAGAWMTSLHSAALGDLTSSEQAGLLLPREYRARNRRLGDLVVLAAPGRPFAAAQGAQLASLGYDGGIVAGHNTLLISGGAAFLRPQVVTARPEQMDENGRIDPTTRLPEQAETVDIAPTISWLLGITDADGAPISGKKGATGPRFEGRVLTEAFRFDGPQPLGACGAP